MSSGWNTIDSDAGVFTELVGKLQVKNVQFDDLYAIDTESLAALAPIYGVVFLFKYGNVDRAHADRPLDGVYDENYQENGVFFANQTIQNACATQAVLNVLFNVEDVDIGPELSNFKSFVTGFDPEMTGETISNSDLIRSVHNFFSSPSLIEDGEKPPPPPDYNDKDDGLFHFIGYVNVNNQIYELDGLKKYPIKHDTLASPEEFLEKLPQVLQRRIAKYGNELRFSLLAITNDKLELAKTIGDDMMVNTEMFKRETWKHENELRRHDYVGLMVELLKNINRDLSDDEYDALLKQARTKSQSKMLQFYKNV